MSKPLCELQRLLARDPERYLAMVLPPKHVCARCGRVANRRKRLCKPKRIVDVELTEADPLLDLYDLRPAQFTNAKKLVH